VVASFLPRIMEDFPVPRPVLPTSVEGVVVVASPLPRIMERARLGILARKTVMRVLISRTSIATLAVALQTALWSLTVISKGVSVMKHIRPVTGKSRLLHVPVTPGAASAFRFALGLLETRQPYRPPWKMLAAAHQDAAPRPQ
jgi:hypothetical protein